MAGLFISGAFQGMTRVTHAGQKWLREQQIALSDGVFERASPGREIRTDLRAWQDKACDEEQERRRVERERDELARKYLELEEKSAPEKRACAFCKTEFVPRIGSGGKPQRFCRVECRAEFHAAAREARSVQEPAAPVDLSLKSAVDAKINIQLLSSGGIIVSEPRGRNGYVKYETQVVFMDLGGLASWLAERMRTAD